MNKIYQILLAGALALGAIGCEAKPQIEKPDPRWTALEYGGNRPAKEDSVKYSRCCLLYPEAYELEKCTAKVREERCGRFPSGYGGQTLERERAVSRFKKCEDAQKELEVEVAGEYY